MALLWEINFPPERGSDLLNTATIANVLSCLEPTFEVVGALPAVSRSIAAKCHDLKSWKNATFTSNRGSHVRFHRSRDILVRPTDGTWDVRYRYDVDLSCHIVTSETISALQDKLSLAGGGGIRSLTIYDGDFDQDTFEELVDIAGLEELILHRCEGVYSYEHLITYARNVRHFELQEMECPITPSFTALEAIAQFPCLQKLVLCNLSSIVCMPTQERACFGHLAACSTLEYLDLSDNSGIRSETIMAIVSMSEGSGSGDEERDGDQGEPVISEAGKALRFVVLRNCAELESLQFITYLPNVERLDVSGCIALSGFRKTSSLSSCPSVKSFLMKNCPLFEDYDSIRTVFPSLQDLDVRLSFPTRYSSMLSGKSVFSFNNLVRVDLSDNRSLTTLAPLQGCAKTLKQLVCKGTPLGDEALVEPLASMLASGTGAVLEELDLSYTAATTTMKQLFEEVEYLNRQSKAQRRHLKFLSLTGCSGVDNTTIVAMVHAVTVSHLCLSSTPKVTCIQPLAHAMQSLQELELNQCSLPGEELAAYARAVGDDKKRNNSSMSARRKENAMIGGWHQLSKITLHHPQDPTLKEGSGNWLGNLLGPDVTVHWMLKAQLAQGAQSSYYRKA